MLNNFSNLIDLIGLGRFKSDLLAYLDNIRNRTDTIYIGTGYEEGSPNMQPVRVTGLNESSISFSLLDEYIYILQSKTLSLSYIMGGIPIPYEIIGEVTIDNVTYSIFKTLNSYSGDIEINCFKRILI